MEIEEILQELPIVNGNTTPIARDIHVGLREGAFDTPETLIDYINNHPAYNKALCEHSDNYENFLNDETKVHALYKHSKKINIWSDNPMQSAEKSFIDFKNLIRADFEQDHQNSEVLIKMNSILQVYLDLVYPRFSGYLEEFAKSKIFPPDYVASTETFLKFKTEVFENAFRNFLHNNYSPDIGLQERWELDPAERLLIHTLEKLNEDPYSRMYGLSIPDMIYSGFAGSGMRSYEILLTDYLFNETLKSLSYEEFSKRINEINNMAQEEIHRIIRPGYQKIMSVASLPLQLFNPAYLNLNDEDFFNDDGILRIDEIHGRNLIIPVRSRCVALGNGVIAGLFMDYIKFLAS